MLRFHYRSCFSHPTVIVNFTCDSVLAAANDLRLFWLLTGRFVLRFGDVHGELRAGDCCAVLGPSDGPPRTNAANAEAGNQGELRLRERLNFLFSCMMLCFRSRRSHGSAYPRSHPFHRAGDVSGCYCCHSRFSWRELLALHGGNLQHARPSHDSPGGENV